MTTLYAVNNPIFRNFVFYAVLLLIKMMAMSLLTVRQRYGKTAFVNPEDVPKDKRKTTATTTSDPDVERVRRNHLNDIENIVPFVLIGFCYIACSPSVAVALWHFRIFFCSRIFHTFAYQIPLPPPSRSVAFLTGLAITVSMGVQILLNVF